MTFKEFMSRKIVIDKSLFLRLIGMLMQMPYWFFAIIGAIAVVVLILVWLSFLFKTHPWGTLKIVLIFLAVYLLDYLGEKLYQNHKK